MKNADSHERILNEIMSRYNRPVMNNVDRGLYVEHLIADALGPDWLPSGWDWAAWDCQHPQGDRIEIKQSAARQSWDVDPVLPRVPPRFDIAPRKVYWKLVEGIWVNVKLTPPRRLADIYVFAWHGREDANANHHDPGQWSFFVVAEPNLCKNQKSIGLGPLRANFNSCRVTDLSQEVETARPARAALKAVLEPVWQLASPD